MDQHSDNEADDKYKHNDTVTLFGLRNVLLTNIPA